MTTIYQKFKKLPLDFSALGLEPGSSSGDYFCTPKGAKVFGWAGVDGIHYCFIKEFGEMVFAVSPCNLPGDYVHPLANDFEDFLRLLLACNGADAIEQAHGWSKAVFEEYLVENQATEAVAKQLELIREAFGIAPMEQPYEYIKKVQAEFDYSGLRFKREYKEYVPEEYWPEKVTEKEKASREETGMAAKENYRMDGFGQGENTDSAESTWAVYYGEGFWSHHGKDKPGQELVINRQFVWNGNVWYIPAVYACSKGLVVDFCIEIEPERIKNFLEKIEQYGDREDKWSDEVREIMNRENPTDIEFSAEVTVNDKVLHMRNGYALGWMPKGLMGMEEEWRAEPEAEQLMSYYGLDREKGWSFHRVSFPWATAKKPVIKAMRVKMKARMVPTIALRFPTPEPGESVQITRPSTGEVYTLTVQEIEEQQMDKTHMEELEKELLFPTHYKQMLYTLSPELPGTMLLVQDCVRSDAPRPKPQERDGSQGTGAVSVAIIGGADGPTAIFLAAGGNQKQLRSACSALHFEPVQEVMWKAVFQEKPCEEEEFEFVLSI